MRANPNSLSTGGGRKMVRGNKIEPVEQLARSVDLLVRLKLQELKNGRTQRDMIRFLGSLGVASGEIASLLGISRIIVDPELSKARAERSSKAKVRSTSRKRKV
jgi:hypothetical protein